MVVRSDSPGRVRTGVVGTTELLALALAAGAAGALCLSVALSPAEAANGPVVCPFRLATGLPCPGCGMTRAWVLLAHGRLGAALSANPFVLVTMPSAGALALLVLGALVLRRPLPDLRAAAGSWIVKMVLAGWLAFGLIRVVAVLTGRASV
jgi:hypothetical protein